MATGSPVAMMTIPKSELGAQHQLQSARNKLGQMILNHHQNPPRLFTMRTLPRNSSSSNNNNNSRSRSRSSNRHHHHSQKPTPSTGQPSSHSHLGLHSLNLKSKMSTCNHRKILPMEHPFSPFSLATPARSIVTTT